MTRIERYMRQYGRGPRFTRRNVTVHVFTTHVIVCRRGQPPYAGATIKRSDLVSLVRWLVPLISEMSGDHDPDEAMSEFLAWEEEHQRELRRQKMEGRRGRRRILKQHRI